MTDTKQTTSWAISSLTFGIIGVLSSVALLALLNEYGEMANRSAGVGSIFMVLHGLVAAVVSLLGVLIGIIALIRIRFGAYRESGMAWAGIGLGCLPLALLVLYLLSGDANPFR